MVIGRGDECKFLELLFHPRRDVVSQALPDQFAQRIDQLGLVGIEHRGIVHIHEIFRVIKKGHIAMFAHDLAQNRSPRPYGLADGLERIVNGRSWRFGIPHKWNDPV